MLAWKKKLKRFLPQLMVMAYVTAIHAVTFPETRYSYPLHVCLSLLIGAAIVETWCKRRTSREKTLAPAANAIA